MEREILIQNPEDRVSLVKIYYGSAVAARDTNICYTHSTFKYGTLDERKQKERLSTRDDIEVEKLQAVDNKGNIFFYACQADKSTSLEVVTSGDVPESVFNYIVQSFHFTLREPVETWKTYEFTDLVNFRLPKTAPQPICDQTGCSSKSTILPGGARFTLTLHTSSLGEFKKEKTKTSQYQSEVTLYGKRTLLFVSSHYKSYLIEVDKDKVLELTLSAPEKSGVDFAADDQIFGEVVGHLQFITDKQSGSSQMPPIR